MATPTSKLPRIGPAKSKALGDAGLTTVQQIAALPDARCKALKVPRVNEGGWFLESQKCRFVIGARRVGGVENSRTEGSGGSEGERERNDDTCSCDTLPFRATHPQYGCHKKQSINKLMISSVEGDPMTRVAT
jgi:hypothetical protein